MKRILVLLGTVVACLPTSAREPKVEIIAHRGASFDAPENTLAAIKLAWEQGADACEFDVWLSRDGQIVLIHDRDTKRVAGLDRPVVEQTYAELRRLDVGRWKQERFAGERIPLLAEVLATVPAGKRVFIEVKCGPEIVPELTRVLTASPLAREQVAVISFHEEVIAAWKKRRPDWQAYWVVNIDPKKRKQPTLAENLIQIAKTIGADGLDLSAHSNLDSAFAKKVQAAGLTLYVWTVNDVQVARRMLDLGVAGITTDRPGWLRQQLRLDD